MFLHDGEDLCLFPGVRIVYRVVQSAAFLALHGLLGYQIPYVYHVAQFAQFAGGFAPLEKGFRLLIEDVQTVPGACQPGIASTMPTYASIIWFTSFML